MWNKEYGNSTLPRTQYDLILLLSFTIVDVLTYDMKSSDRYYPAGNGLDGNMNTQASTAYGGDNLTYWDVRLKRNFAITRVYAMVCMHKPSELRS